MMSKKLIALTTIVVDVALYIFVSKLLAAVLPFILLVFAVYYVVDYKLRRFQTKRVTSSDQVKFYTFANHKGGVGKSTIAFFTVRQFSRECKGRNVLVLDFSIFGDLTKLCLGLTPDRKFQRGRDLLRAGATIEDALSNCLMPRAWYEFWRKPFSFLNHIQQLPGVPNKNVFILTNKKQMDEGYDAAVVQLSDADVSRVIYQIREDLKRSGKKWLVVVDTDGGEMHGYTQLAIGIADSIIIPLTAGMGALHDADRLTRLFNYSERLRQQGLSKATVDYAVFNMAVCSRGVPWEENGTIFSPFTPHKDVQEIMKAVVNLFDEWQLSYPDLLQSMTKKSGDCYGAIRAGGKDFKAAAADPWTGDAGNAQGDIEQFANKLLSIVPGEGVGGRRLDAAMQAAAGDETEE
jgi:cellulose biosynthesis protein BcsQ